MSEKGSPINSKDVSNDFIPDIIIMKAENSRFKQNTVHANSNATTTTRCNTMTS